MIAVAQRHDLRPHSSGCPDPGGKPNHGGNCERAALFLPNAV